MKKAFKTLLTVVGGIGFFIGAIAGWVLGILGSIIHIWTIIIAFVNKGILATIITACLPVLAEIYWFMKVWNEVDTLVNPYCITVMAFVGLGLIALLVFALGVIGVSVADRR